MRILIDHVSINVSNLARSRVFYQALLGYFGFKKAWEDGWSNGSCGIGINAAGKGHREYRFHRKNVGVNHIAFRMPTKKSVDDFYKKFLIPRRIPVLYGGPKEYPEYSKGYYAVYFEDPNRLKIEVVSMP